MVCLSAGHRVHAAGGILRQPFRAALAPRRDRSTLTPQTRCRRYLASRPHGACCWPISPPAHRWPAERSTTQPCFRSSFSTGRLPAIPTLAVVCAVAGYIAYRDVKLSAEIMLWIEAVSVSLIVIVLVLLPCPHRLSSSIPANSDSEGMSFCVAGACAGAFHLQLCGI